MTQCTKQWIYDNFISGMELAHGKPWWSNPATDNPANHFDGPIPLDVVRKLFGFDVFLSKVWVEDHLGRMFLADEFVAVVPDNKEAVFGIHSKSYSIDGHKFDQWLLDGPAKVINGEVGMSNAGLLQNGAQAWVNISTPQEWKTPQGVNFRPQLLWATGLDGKLASIVKETEVISLCDNTMHQALGSKGLSYSVKHTKNSQFKLDDAKAALQLLEQNGERYAAEIAALCAYQVNEDQFQRFMSQLVPMPEITDKDINKRDYSTRTATMAANKREKLNELYRIDGRVAPWQGTAFGVLQMVNTYTTHIATQRNSEHRAARNMENVISGKMASTDLDAMLLLSKICDRELVAV